MYIHVKRRVDPSIEHEGKVFYPIIKGSKCKLIDIIEDKKEAGGGKCDDE